MPDAARSTAAADAATGALIADLPGEPEEPAELELEWIATHPGLGWRVGRLAGWSGGCSGQR